MVKVHLEQKQQKTSQKSTLKKRSDHGLPPALAEHAFFFDQFHKMRTKHRKLGITPHAKGEKELISDAEINKISDEETRLRKKLEVEEKAFEDGHMQMMMHLEAIGAGFMCMSTPSMLKQEQELKQIRKSVLAYDLRNHYVVEDKVGVITEDIEKWKGKFQDADIWNYTEVKAKYDRDSGKRLTNAMFKFKNFNKKVLGDW